MASVEKRCLQVLRAVAEMDKEWGSGSVPFHLWDL